MVGTDEGKLYGIDRASGSIAWEYQTGGAITAGPTAVGNLLFVGSLDRKLYAFSMDESAGSVTGASVP